MSLGNSERAFSFEETLRAQRTDVEVKDCVIVCNGEKGEAPEYLVQDPCGWPIFDDYLCGRTTWYTEEKATEYTNNLVDNGFKELSVWRITKLK